jgi:hypothetical protein
MMLTIPRRVLLLAMALTLAVLGLVYAGTRPAHSATFSKNGVSITVSVTCPSNGTTVTKVSSSGGNPGYAARIRSSSGTWYQGTEVNSGTASKYISAQKNPAHGTRIFWASGAQNYTFC